jgi:hypothetical protein
MSFRLGTDLRICCYLLIATVFACGARTADPPAGAGGTAGAGGSAGTEGGVSGTEAGVSGTDGAACGCVGIYISWGMRGGRPLFNETSALHDCDVFDHQRAPVSGTDPMTGCRQVVTECVGGVRADDIRRAFNHPDVLAAIPGGLVLYGQDPRPHGGQVLNIRVPSVFIDVGEPCVDAGCRPIPPGIDALATLLRRLTKQELDRAPCRDVFPPRP